MKTLSLYQPWATLVVIGAKRWETRSWKTAYRGPLLIHASKRFDGYNQRLAKEEPFFSALLGQACLTGMIIGKVDLVKCIPTEAWLKLNTLPGKGCELFLKPFSDIEYEFGDFSDGRYAWKLENPVKFDKPVKNFVDTVHEMRKAQSQLALQGSKVNPVDVKRLEDAVDIRIGMIRELL